MNRLRSATTWLLGALMIGCMWPGSGWAQASGLGRSLDVREMVDVALEHVLSERTAISRVTVGRRGIVFDLARTRDAFSVKMPSAAVLAFSVRSQVRTGAHDLLSDCDLIGRMKCALLGWSVYVWVEPVALSDSSAILRVHAFWPDRGTANIDAPSPTLGLASLVWFSAEIHVARSASGTWRFVKQGVTTAGD